jgi:hypothetical protein
MDFTIKVCMGVLAALMLAIWITPKEKQSGEHPLVDIVINVFVGLVLGIVALIIFLP